MVAERVRGALGGSAPGGWGWVGVCVFTVASGSASCIRSLPGEGQETEARSLLVWPRPAGGKGAAEELLAGPSGCTLQQPLSLCPSVPWEWGWLTTHHVMPCHARFEFGFDGALGLGGIGKGPGRADPVDLSIGGSSGSLCCRNPLRFARLSKRRSADPSTRERVGSFRPQLSGRRPSDSIA